MPDNNPLEQAPAEGDRDVVERELKRQEKEPAKENQPDERTAKRP